MNGLPPDGEARLARQLAFLLELDKLKEVQRRTRLLGSRRLENSAEHSWHATLAALVLLEHACPGADILHTLKMLLVHDIVEIDAGDTFAFGDQSHKAHDEAAAAARIFGLLPADQRDECLALWREFEERTTPEARFANAVDRLMPVLYNYHGGGGTWREHGVTEPQVYSRLSPIGDGAPDVWTHVQTLLAEACARGDILPARSEPG